MVYIEPVHLGWRAIIQSWANVFREVEKEEKIDPKKKSKK
jgi:hypothetical protein